MRCEASCLTRNRRIPLDRTVWINRVIFSASYFIRFFFCQVSISRRRFVYNRGSFLQEKQAFTNADFMRINFIEQSRKTCIPISRGLRRRAMTLYFLLNVRVVSFFFLRRGVNYSLPWWYLLDNRPGTHTTSVKFSSPLYFFFSFSSLEARASSRRLIFSLFPGKNRNSRGGFARDANTQIVFR